MTIPLNPRQFAGEDTGTKGPDLSDVEDTLPQRPKTEAQSHSDLWEPEPRSWEDNPYNPNMPRGF